jgi:hypothetical protein
MATPVINRDRSMLEFPGMWVAKNRTRPNACPDSDNTMAHGMLRPFPTVTCETTVENGNLYSNYPNCSNCTKALVRK